LEELSLSKNQLTGSIPQEIGNLSNLERLLLSDNQLTGSIPPEIGNLTNLTYLSLTRNQLSGTIPESIANLSSLETLALGGNQITGTVKIFLGDLSTINEIYLWGNQLTGSIPSEIGQLSNLTDLWLNDNDLSESLPESLGQLDNLEDLILYNNEFSGTLPESIGNISTLDRIAINTIPNLTGPIPDSWTNLNLSLFFFEETNLCEPDNTTFSNWKASIDDYSGTEIQCTTANANPTIADQTFGIDENSDNGTSIGTVIASDPDDDPLTYSITAGNTGTTFAINSSTGELTIADNTLLDFETNPSFGLSVAVDDGNSGSASGTITVNLIQNQVLGTVSTNPSFVIYPNPVTNKFSLAHSSEFDEIILMSLDGSALKKFHVNLSNEYDIADLNTGTYLLTGKNGNKTIHIGRIIKQ